MAQIKILIIDDNAESVIDLLKNNNCKIFYNKDIDQKSIIVEDDQIDLVISYQEENTILKELLKNNRDDLTKLYNKDYFFNEINNYNETYSIMMIDIDNFKQINDKFGHVMGDEVLKKIAKILENSLRKKDLIARFGGDEFIIFLATNKENAHETAERLRNSIEKFNELNFSITASFGIAQYEHEENLEAVIVRADKALYQAKNKGKNRAVISSKACF